MSPTAIEWTEETWNPTTGCSKVSPGCDHCYAETLSLRYGWSKLPWTPENAAENVVLHPERLEKPLTWRKPRVVFVNSMSDLFHELIPYEFVREVFNVMRRCDGRVIAATGKRSPAHTFQVLTKRPQYALKLWQERKLGFETWPPHIWLGTSIESWQFNYRADQLRRVPAAVRFISAEPLLDTLYPPDHPERHLDLDGIDWLIVGGESGHSFRPMRTEWARELRDRRNGTAFFFKQWGGRTPKAGGRLLDGREWNEMPRMRSLHCLPGAECPRRPVRPPGSGGPVKPLGWHVLSGEHLLEMLRRVQAGEDPDMVYAEEYANADHEEVAGDAD